MNVVARVLAGLTAVLLLQLTLDVSAQEPTRLPQRPTFRGGISIVPVDVRVIDNSGRPVTDLKQEDFTIKEDGVPQAIRHFSTMTFTADFAAAKDAGAPDVKTAPAQNLLPVNRRVFLIVMGRGRHQAVSKYLDALADFIATKTLPQDHIALVAWNRATDFTNDKALVGRVIQRYKENADRIEMELREYFSGLRALYGPKVIPQHTQQKIDAVFGEFNTLRPRPLAPAPMTNAKQVDEQIQRTTYNLQRAAEIQDRLDNGFKTLTDPVAAHELALTGLAFDEYMAQMTETMQDIGNLYAAIGYLRMLDGEKHLVFVTERGVSLPDQSGNASLARVAADARIALDFIQTGGVVTSGPVQITTGRGVRMPPPVATTNQAFGQLNAFQDLRLMADRTGGQVMLLRTGEEAFRRLDDGMKFQYLLGYTPSNPTLDGKFRKISVDVNRRGVRVLVREGYMAVDSPIIMDRRQMVTFNRIRAAAEFFDTIDHIKLTLGKPVIAGKELSVDVTIDISRLKFAERDGRREVALDVVLFCGGENGARVCNAQHLAELRLGPETFARAQQQGLTVKITAPVTGVVRTTKVIVYDYAADLIGSAVTTIAR